MSMVPTQPALPPVPLLDALVVVALPVPVVVVVVPPVPVVVALPPAPEPVVLPEEVAAELLLEVSTEPLQARRKERPKHERISRELRMS
jgi:hypothetical protein